MSRTSNQKLKLIYLLKILNEKSDENNSLTVNEIILELNFYNGELSSQVRHFV